MKFSELLSKAGKSAEPDREKIRSRAKRAAGQGAFRAIAGLTAAVLLVGLIAGGIYTGFMNVPIASASDIPEELAEVSPITSVRATDTEGGEVSAATAFKVTTKKAMSKDEFREAFAVSPAVNYTVEKNNGNTFTVSFESGLKGNTLYTLSSMSGEKTVYSWAFQTDNRFRITGHYPDTGYFEPDTAVSVDFTHSNVENFDRYFSIYPAVSGKFKHNGRRWIFLPDEPFEAYVPYTVTVSGDIIGGDGETLGEDYVFSFICEQDGSYVRLSYKGEGRSDCFLPSQTPAACIEYNDFEPDTADITVFSVPSADEFADLLGRYTSAGVVSPKIEEAAAGYDKLLTFTAEPAPAGTDGYDEKAYFAYPRSFDKGYYVSKIEFSGMTRFHLFSVSDLAVYSMSSGGSYVVWVNDTVSGSAVEGATAEVAGVGSGTTGGDGVATVTGKAGEDSAAVLKVKTQSGSSYVAAIGATGVDEYSEESLNCYSYLYTDSEFYRPGDEVHVWGFVLPRASGVKAPKSVDLYTQWDDKTVSVELKDGGFETTFTLSGTVPDNYGMIEMQTGGRRLTSSAFEIIDYELPVYTVDVATDKNAYYEGEEIMYTVKVAHFDKTPAENVSVHVMGEDEDTYVDTDENGLAHYLTTARLRTYDEYGENNGANGFGLSFSVVEPDGNSLTSYRDVAVFGSAVTAEEKQDDSEIEISLYNVDLSGLNGQQITAPYGIYALTADPASYRGTAREANVRVDLHHVRFIKEELESHLNPVTMQVERVYDYTQTDDVESTGTVTAEGGRFSLVLPEAKEEGESYYYYIYTEDDEGRTLCARTSNAFYYTNYEFESTGYSLETDKKEYSEGETIKLKLKKDDGGEVSGGRFLVSGVNCEVLENKVFAAPDGELAFTSRYRPDAYISAVFFDGKDLHLVRIATVEAVSKELDIEIIPDRQTYAPGDTVTLDVGVSFGGKSEPATVNVSVVDSAMYSMFYNDADIYESVYFSRKYASLLKREISTYSNDKDTQYGEGGGGGGEVRSDFTATPLFKTVKTDASGHVKVSFKLPDTITGWHITAQAYTADVKVGRGSAEVTSTKDFYIYTSAADGIKASDDAVFPIRFLSSTAQVGTQCLYTAELFKNNEVIDSESQVSVIGGIVTKNFGKLEVGDYILRVTGKLGDVRDAMELPFTVTETAATAYSTKRQVIDGQTAISGEFTTDVTVNVYDEEYEMYLNITDDLLSRGEHRLEQAIGRAAARAVRNGQTGPSYEDIKEFSSYASEDGITLFDVNGYVTLDSAAFITAVAGKYFDKETQIGYYNLLLDNGLTDTDALCAYWGLAALGEPVLDDLGSVKAGIAALTDTQKLYLALAYAYAGDHASAREIYSVLSGKLMTANGVTEFSADGAYDTEYMSALAAMLAIKLHTPECKSLTKYMLGCENQTVKREPVLTAFLNDFIPYLGGSNTVTVTHADGRSEKITYRRTECATVKVPYGEIGSVKFSSDAGGSIMSVSGKAKASAVVAGMTPLDAQIGVYFEQETGTDGLALVQVTAKLPDGYEGNPTLYVNLPYPFRIQSVEMPGDGSCAVEQNRKNAQLYIVNGYANAIFHCYVAAAGEFEIEPVYVIDETHGAARAAESVKITMQ